jgi:hypothetical protein
MSEAMFTLCGQVLNVFVQPGGVSKKTGEEYEARDKVQLLGDLPQPDGQKRLELVTLTVDDARPYQAVSGKRVRVPVGFFANGKSVQFYIPKGSRLELAGGAA